MLGIGSDHPNHVIGTVFGLYAPSGLWSLLGHPATKTEKETKVPRLCGSPPSVLRPQNPCFQSEMGKKERFTAVSGEYGLESGVFGFKLKYLRHLR